MRQVTPGKTEQALGGLTGNQDVLITGHAPLILVRISVLVLPLLSTRGLITNTYLTSLP